MDKINQLLNENTIVDFSLLWKIALRYRSHLLVAILFFFGIFSFNYYAQPVIYAVNIPMKAITNHTVANDLSALLPVETANSINLSELKISLDNFSFFKSYAELVIQDPEFERLNFGSIAANKNLYGLELKRTCGKVKECLVNRLANSLKGSFSVEQGFTENRFILTLIGIDKITVQNLTPILLKAIEANRIHVRQYLVLKEIQSVGNLITEGRSIIERMNGYKELEEQEKLHNNIADLRERIRMLQSSTGLEMANFTSLESKLSENKRSTKIKSTNQNDFEKIQKTQARLVEIRQNIFILSNIRQEDRSVTDNLIIAQLTEERSRLLKSMPPESNHKSMVLTAKFVEGQREKFDDYEFDYLVAKNKLEKLNQDYENSKKELNEMLQQKIVNENKVIGMKADLDFLKNLESKQMSLKLLNATMTSDIFFEDVRPDAQGFRQSTYLKMFLFSFSITAFFYLISVIWRHLVDDRIYGEDEIRSHIKDLDFIGEVPSFEKINSHT